MINTNRSCAINGLSDCGLSVRGVPLALMLSLPLAACSSPMNAQPDIKLNPHPVQRYEITVTTDAPGPFDSAKGYAGYQVGNVDCVPKDAFEDARNVPNMGHDLALTRVGDKTYTGYFYLDQLQDADYFGLGVCHFDLTSVWAGFEVHGMTFGAIVSADALSAQKPTVWYTPKKTYFDANQHAHGFAAPMNDFIAKNADQFFSVTVVVRRAEP